MEVFYLWPKDSCPKAQVNLTKITSEESCQVLRLQLIVKTLRMLLNSMMESKYKCVFMFIDFKAFRFRERISIKIYLQLAIRVFNPLIVQLQ